MTESRSKRASRPLKKALAVVIVLVLLVGGGIWLWEEVLEERFVPKRFGLVKPGLIYRSGQVSRFLIEDVLRDHQIKIVVDLTAADPECPDEQAEIAASEKLGIERHVLPLTGDSTGDINHYFEALKILDRAVKTSSPVLIHCAAGAQRTGAAVGFYRVLEEKWSAAEVKEELIRYDWKPHKDQILLEYMDEHMQELADRLLKEKIITSVPSPLPVMSK